MYVISYELQVKRFHLLKPKNNIIVPLLAQVVVYKKLTDNEQVPLCHHKSLRSMRGETKIQALLFTISAKPHK